MTLYPFCSECNSEQGVAVATVSAETDAENRRQVERVLLECGHVTRPEKQTRIEDGVVRLLQMHRPDTIEVRG